jgi:hypothetical protein
MAVKPHEDSSLAVRSSPKGKILNHVTSIRNYLETIRLMVGDDPALNETIAKIDIQLAGLGQIAEDVNRSRG